MNRRQNQVIRGVVALLFVAAYVARLVTVGKGEVMILGYEMTVIGLVAVVLVVLALPETIEMLPFGPSNNN